MQLKQLRKIKTSIRYPLQYTKPSLFITTLALKNADGHISIIMIAKKVIVCKSIFLSPPVNSHNEPLVQLGIIHKTVTNEVIYKAFMTQSTFKVPGPDKINCQIFRIILECDSEWFVVIVRHSITLGYQPQRQKKT